MRHARIHTCGMLILLVLFSQTLFAQYNTSLEEDICNEPIDFSRALAHGQFLDYYFVIVKLNGFPSAQKLEAFEQNGIRLLQYKGGLNYLTAIPIHLDTQQLLDLDIQSIKAAPLESKISKAIQNGAIPSYARHKTNWLDVAVVLNQAFSEKEWETITASFEITPLQKINSKGTIQTIRISEDVVESLAAHPNIQWIEPIEPAIKKLNHENIQIQRTNVLHSTALGGRALTGESVVIGVGDGGELGDHIDLNCRIINQADGTYASYGAHGDHVSGTIAGAGNLNPLVKGMAPKAELIIEKTTKIIYNTTEYVENYGMVITNNSYGVGADCASNGSYNYSSINLDMQLRENPELIHLFAAGNSGNDTCNDYPQGFKTVLRYYGSAKNVLTVGAVDENEQIANLSSRGPVADGRTKPEVCGPGVNVESTGRNFDYFEISGTSMSTPSVAGTIALLYERFRQLYNGANPRGALMKAITCNTADDLGNVGPDYSYGFGLVNAKRAIETIEKGQFEQRTIAHADIETHTIEVPTGVAQLKIMLYWHDKEADVEAEHVLVNDLDIKVFTPSGGMVYPWVLNPAPDFVSEVATRGFDRLNNIEQVTIDNPEAGAYIIQIRGFQIPMGVQDYIITYDLVYPEVELTYPFGQETLIPNTKEMIQWDAASTNTDTFVLEYSPDGGTTWNNIADAISPTARQFVWNVPTSMTEHGKIRIHKTNDTHYSSNQTDFRVLTVPKNLWVASPCDTKIELTWDSLDYAQAYEVFLLDCDEMVSVGTTEEPRFLLEGNLLEDFRYWFSVRAVATDGSYSQRTIADFCYPSMQMECIEEEPIIDEEVDSTSGEPEVATSVIVPIIGKERVDGENEEEEMEGESLFNDLRIYPNPFQEKLHITLNSTLFNIDAVNLKDLLGHSMLPFINITKVEENAYEIQLDDRLPAGVYYLQVVKGQEMEYFPVVKL